MSRVAAFALILLACTPEPQTPSGGEEGWGPTLEDAPTRRHEVIVPHAIPIPESERVRWELADTLGELTAAELRTPSEHLEGVFDRTVAFNALAAAYPHLTRASAMPPGALVVQRHHPRGEESVAVLFVMRRLAAGASPATRDWEFLVLDDALRVAAKSNLEPCARCHADAPFDGLFGFAVPQAD